VQGRFAALAAEHAAAQATADGEALDRVADEFATTGALLLAAECGTEAAVAHRSAGRSGSALTSEARARDLLDQCGPAATPVLLAGTTAPEVASLTAREREVAGLAARGLTKREIADRLFLSVRTVGNHLNHVYGKLGLSDRDELARVLGPEE
jgi:DNA-binding CsgD family transcriptional regulator